MGQSLAIITVNGSVPGNNHSEWISLWHETETIKLTTFCCRDKLQFCSGVQTEYDPVTVAFRYIVTHRHPWMDLFLIFPFFHSKSKGHILYSLEKTGPSEYTPFTYEYADRKVSEVTEY